MSTYEEQLDSLIALAADAGRLGCEAINAHARARPLADARTAEQVARGLVPVGLIALR